MEKQKVCIIGGGLTGLVTAITLSRLNLKIDLVTAGNVNKKTKSTRTIAVSQNIIDFRLKKNTGKINVGFISPDFRAHPVGYCIRNIIIGITAKKDNVNEMNHW